LGNNNLRIFEENSLIGFKALQLLLERDAIFDWGLDPGLLVTIIRNFGSSQEAFNLLAHLGMTRSSYGLESDDAEYSLELIRQFCSNPHLHGLLSLIAIEAAPSEVSDIPFELLDPEEYSELPIKRAAVKLRILHRDFSIAEIASTVAVVKETLRRTEYVHDFAAVILRSKAALEAREKLGLSLVDSLDFPENTVLLRAVDALTRQRVSPISKDHSRLKMGIPYLSSGFAQRNSG
jgi:hypothetical protein